jgi:hypothetical protein
LILGRGSEGIFFFLIASKQTLGAHLSSYPTGVGGSFPGVKWKQEEAGR